MDVVGSFVDASAYTQRYQRNNKRSGLKNLRCFPMCSDEHKLRGFCGRPAYVQVSNPLGKDLCSYACFVKLPGKKDNSKNNTQHLIKIGDIISVTDMESQTRSKQDPFQHYIRGEMPEDIIENDPQLTFIFNKNKKGWHYGWVANKHTCDSEHVLRAYIFEKTDNGKTLIARHFVDCPSFTIFCRRRQRQNLDRLPPQLKVQLELQDAMKKKQASANKNDETSLELPRSISVADIKRENVTPQNLLKRVQKRKTTNAPKRTSSRKKKKSSSIDDEEYIPPYNSTITTTNRRNNNTPVHVVEEEEEEEKKEQDDDNVEKITYEEKQQLLYHVIRALLRLNVKTTTPLSVAEASEIQLFDSSGDALMQREMDDFSKSISDCLDCFTIDSGENRIDGNSTGSTDLGSLDDFKEFDIDFSVLSYADFTPLEEKSKKPKNVQFGDVIKRFADYLINEQKSSEMIEQAMILVGPNGTPEQYKSLGISLLLDVLKQYLEQFNITLDELFHLFKSQVWNKKETESREQHIAIAKKAEKAFVSTIEYYAKTIATRIKHDKENDQVSSPRCVMDQTSSLLSSISSSSSSSSSSVEDNLFASSPFTRNIPKRKYIPQNDPCNDLTGHWTRPIETLNILESIRESMGVPWVIRKLLRYLEHDLELYHLDNVLVCQSNRKLFSSGYQPYILDGKVHEWSLPPPIPTAKPLVLLTYEATLCDGKLQIIHNYSKHKRINRVTFKSPCGNRLESSVRFQYRESVEKPWEDKLNARCMAERKTEIHSNTNQPFSTIKQEEELGWIPAPLDDFALSSL